MSVILDFLLGILGNIAASILMGLHLQRLIPNTYRRFWDPFFTGGLTIITPAEEKELEVKSQVMDFQGLDALKGVLQKYYPNKYEQIDCDNVSPEVLQRNLLLVAGPIANSVTAHILESSQRELRYYFDQHTLIDRQNPGSPLAFALKSDQMSPAVDYGLITCLKNPFNRRKRVLVSAGLYGWGTYAALKSLSRAENLKILAQQAGSRDYQVLVRVGVFRRVPEEPVLLEETLQVLAED